MKKFTADSFSRLFCDTMNKSPMGQWFMHNLAKEANKRSFTQEQFDKVKADFYKDVLAEMLKSHPELF